jgi:hypothetical protein
LGQTYSTNLDDADGSYLSGKITPIGDLGDIKSILDLRGFIPISCASKAKTKKQLSSVLNFFTDDFQYYQYPPISSIAYLYYGKDDEKTLAKVSSAKLVTEDQLQDEDKQWAKFAYGLARSSGKDLYKSINGSSSGFDAAEPVTVLLTARSAIVIMSFKYSDFDRKGTGQVLCGFEFSRTLKEYKNFYELYSTTVFARSAKNAFSTSEPYITKALSLYFTGQ